MSDNETKLGLSSQELACLTARVPASGNPGIDAIITQGLRFQAAQEFMAAMIDSAKWAGSKESLAKDAVAYAEALIRAFQAPRAP